MELTGKREIRAPTKDWLTKGDVAQWFGFGEEALDVLIAAGQFPQGFPWTGKGLRWWWEDVIFRELHLKVAARLVTQPAEEEAGRKRTGNRPE